MPINHSLFSSENLGATDKEIILLSRLILRLAGKPNSLFILPFISDQEEINSLFISIISSSAFKPDMSAGLSSNTIPMIGFIGILIPRFLNKSEGSSPCSQFMIGISRVFRLSSDFNKKLMFPVSPSLLERVI